MADFPTRFARESWSLYGVGIGMIVLRFVARIRRNGISNLMLDDYVMLNCVAWYTLLCVSFNINAHSGGSNLMTQEEIDNLTPESKEARIIGSKWIFVSEHAMMATIWSTKFCMLILYAHLTEGLRQRKWIKWVGIYTALSFVASELAIFLACRPLYEYWTVPTANIQCSTYQHTQIVNAAVSFPGDFAILGIGIPILARLHMPIQQKAMLIGVFGMGIFIIIAAILTKIYGLVPSLLTIVYMNWYFREASVAVYVTNLPCVWPLIREIFPGLQTLGTSKPATLDTGSRIRWGGSRRNRLASDHDPLDMRSFNKGPSTESQERINETSDFEDSNHIAIKRDATFAMQTEDGSPHWTEPDGGWREKRKAMTGESTNS